MPYITDAALNAATAARLKRVGVDMSTNAYWPSIITDANNWAYLEILRRMAMRGFTATDLADWTEAARFNTRLGMWYAISEAGVGEDFAEKMLDRLDERDRLWNYDGDNLVVPISSSTGLIINPSQSVVITTGLENTSQDLFAPPYPNDPRLDPPNGPLF